MNPDLPNFVVLNSAKWSGKVNVQGLYARLWGAGFLPAKHQGVTFQASGAPVLFLENPPGVDLSARRRMLDLTRELESAALRANWRSRNQHDDFPAGDGVPNAKLDPGANRYRGWDHHSRLPAIRTLKRRGRFCG